MKKILLIIIVIGWNAIASSQTVDLKKFTLKSESILKKEVVNDSSELIDFKINSAQSAILTRKETIVNHLSFLKDKANRALAEYDIEKQKLNSLSGDEKLAKFDQLKEMLVKGNTRDKQSTLLDKAMDADNKKKYVVFTKINYNLKLSDNTNKTYESHYYHKLNGEEIADIYNYIILNP